MVGILNVFVRARLCASVCVTRLPFPPELIPLSSEGAA